MCWVKLIRKKTTEVLMDMLGLNETLEMLEKGQWGASGVYGNVF